MKNIYRILLFLAVLSLSSCYKDEGNYDYREMPKVTINGIPEKCEAFIGSNLKVPVEIVYENGAYEDVSYEWRLQGKVISTEKDLDVMVNFEAKPNQYADFSVIDNATGLRTIKIFTMDVSTEFSKGWMILSNESDHSELSYIRPDGRLYDNIYEKLNGEKLSANAVQIKEHWLPWSDKTGEIFIGAPEGPNHAVELDGNTFKRMVYSKDEFLEGAPDNFAPVSFEAVGGWDYMFSNKKLYTRYIKDPFDANYHTGKFVRLPVPGDYELLPFTFKGNVMFSYEIFAFDALHKSYKVISDGVISDFNTSYDSEKAFNPTNMNKTLLTAGAISVESPVDIFVSMLKGDDGKIYMQKFKFSGWSNKTFRSMEEKEFPNPELVKEDTQWAICMGRPYVYFNSGNKLYVYNHQANTVKELQGTKFDGKIKAIAICPTDPEELAVASVNKNDASRCDFMLLNVGVVQDGAMKPGTLKEAAFGNVRNITYKVGLQFDIAL